VAEVVAATLASRLYGTSNKAGANPNNTNAATIQ
jgi:hypothetical protein